MTASKPIKQFVKELEAKGITLWLEDEQLHYSAAKSVWTPERAAEVKTHKAEIIAWLRQQSHSVDPYPPQCRTDWPAARMQTGSKRLATL